MTPSNGTYYCICCGCPTEPKDRALTSPTCLGCASDAEKTRTILYDALVAFIATSDPDTMTDHDRDFMAAWYARKMGRKLAEKLARACRQASEQVAKEPKWRQDMAERNRIAGEQERQRRLDSAEEADRYSTWPAWWW
jgi:hypothetical protein